MTVHDKLDEIESLSKKNKGSLERVLELCEDKEDEIRFRAVERLVDFDVWDVMNAILTACQDSDELVRVAAFEGIGHFRHSAARETVRSGFDDESELVRRGAAGAAGRLGDVSFVDVLRTKLKDASDPEQTSLLDALYRLGEVESLDDLLGLLNSPSYHARCSVASSVADLVGECLVDNHQRDIIVRHLNNASAKERTAAAKSSITSALKEIEGLS